MKLEDIIALAKSGYKVNDIKELLELSKVTENSPEASGSEKDAPEDEIDEKDEEKSTFNQASINDGGKPEDNADAVDYKKLYEETKNKLEKAQKENINKSTSTSPAKSEEEILKEIAQKFI